ncbi:DUF1592 domain-containing protein [Tautonia plasticadhaerens]|uniref:Planctomycete cytochrome C n=1 Tax=Tautonia plasticadhaerens TaxID=2527974 RepID=A0A518HDZ8_9BACT|nr:DUF1592 domain-containing protein [Tautonia plasticadhaerens]QDV39078.1 Planctomycete cytochrome C [Tautonia plasticadhaerens]
MRTRGGWWVGLAILGPGLAPAVSASGALAVGDEGDRGDAAAIAARFGVEAGPVLRTYCFECHASEVAEGGIDLEAFDGIDDPGEESETWQDVARVLDLGEMPPEGALPLPQADRDRLRGWVARFLGAKALADAGDPGPVVLRRLTNAQYEHTIRDLTGLDLDPAREFPTDGAAGEGFTNSGGALVMSPSLLEKYLRAASEVADHAVPLPGGVRFSPAVSRRDRTDEAVDRIRSFYGRFADGGDGTRVDLQGIVFDTNEGGRLPLGRYLSALVEARDEIRRGDRTPGAVAEARGLSPKYLRLLWEALEVDRGPSLLLDPLRRAWRSADTADAASAISDLVAPWQESLWRFNRVGHIGKVGGPPSWMEPVSPLVDRQEVRVAFPGDLEGVGDEVRLTLSVRDAGEGTGPVAACWESPRIVTPGRPDLPLRDLRAVARRLEARRDETLGRAVECLDAASEILRSPDPGGPREVADRLGIPPDVLGAWFSYLGVGEGPPTIPADEILSGPISGAGGHEFVAGWGEPGTPNVVANSSDEHVRIPGKLRPHSVAMHPSPSLRVAAGWRSPVGGAIRVEGRVEHAHPECGDGVSWRLELRGPGTRRRLASGTARGTDPVAFGPFEGLPVGPGDLVCLSIGPRDGNHACDLTAVDLAVSAGERSWDLAADVSPDIGAGNPHADRLGNPEVWAFFTESDGEASADSVIPDGSLLARWLDESDREVRRRLARQIGGLIDDGPPADPEAPDAALRRQLTSYRGPLLGRLGAIDPDGSAPVDGAVGRFGIDPDRFGTDPEGRPIDGQSLGVRSGSVIEVRLPAGLVAGSEFVATGRLLGEEGSVQFLASASTPDPNPGPGPIAGVPIVAAEGSRARSRVEADLAAFRDLFPPALCYSEIVPVDEVITLMLHYREDVHLRRLMLDDRQQEELDRLWEELRFISQDDLEMVGAFQQLLEYASQDGDPGVFEPLRGPIERLAEAFRRELIEAEPRQLDAVIDFAALAYRRPLEDGEAETLRALYHSLREEPMPHDEAIRLTIARILVAPPFLYRVERPGPGSGPSPVSAWELASRLSYFLWSSMPNEALRARAESGELLDPDVLAGEARRMLDDARVRRLAEEFACQWLQVYDFPSLDEKSERHFPSFASLRPAMYEETIRFFEDLFRNDRPVWSILDADYAFLNEDLARHYGIEGVAGPDWRRVDGVSGHGRGGILGLASTLSKQSGASRTSPILRGNWVSEVLLGERLPRPPKDVPPLPEDEGATDGLTVRELVERHTQDPRCMTCHRRIDPFGFALERYDAIGRLREADLGGRAIDAASRLPDGAEVDGIEGLRRYLLEDRRDAFARQFCRKLLGYALGRGVRLSDEPLLDEMRRGLDEGGGRVSAAIEAVVRSPQFLEIRGRDFAAEAPPR